MDWLLHPRRRAFADALVVTWVLLWAVAGWTAGRALDRVSEVTHSAEGAGAADGAASPSCAEYPGAPP